MTALKDRKYFFLKTENTDKSAQDSKRKKIFYNHHYNDNQL